MKRHIPGLSTAVDSPTRAPDGLFLVLVESAQHRWHAQKPFYALRFSVLEPKQYAGTPIIGRLYCTSRAMWKLGWFLRDFFYDPELLSREEIDECAVRGLTGVVKISHTLHNGVSLVNLDGFAPAGQWETLSAANCVPPQSTTTVSRAQKERTSI